MRLFLILFLCYSSTLYAETYVYFANNTALNFNVTTTQTGTHTLDANEWNATASTILPWKHDTEIMWTNRNTGIHNNDDFYFNMHLVNGTDSITLQLRLEGTFTGSDMWTSATGPNFNHPWYSNNNFYEATFMLGSKMYTLKYHSYFAGTYNDVFYALQEHDPFPINLADTGNTDILNILAYNIYMLTPPINNTNQSDRAAVIADHVQGYDAIIFSEAFYNSARSDLKSNLLSEYPYHTDVVDQSGSTEDGGVFIASRFPILQSAQIVFDDCDGSDCLASKGVMYAKINKQGRIIHLFGTHTQAWTSSNNIATRILQLKQLQNFISSLNIPTNEIVLIGGDLNVDKIANHSGEYDGMLDSLQLIEPSFLGHNYSYDPTINYYGSGPQEFLDYVMAQQNHLNPISSTNEVLILRDIQDNQFNTFDLSDHLAVRGRFELPPLVSNTTLLELKPSNINIYPNPNNGSFTIDFGRTITGNLIVTNTLGQIIHQESLELLEQQTIQLAQNISSGCYYVYVQDKSSNQVYQQTIIIR